MPILADRVRRLLPSGLTSLAGIACAACCIIPLLLGAGVLSGVGWVAAGSWMPGITVVLAATAAGTWWWMSRRRHRTGCAGADCACGTR
ncbi:hypothetical protein Ait01nite_093230 [Actinoplanes italicus]|jgi:hypothetical protein|uniref:Mercuric ion transport protein n=1 Tax=Actinoplanes italicus TaxID=113567 RepID=A0A2T0JQ38_9ACTN|nr:hypothetical protein [Actinoplanes italicus]PRX09752.1 mercuric ion transport protein [Actinoplanes italicus]GIE36278.1 hypothetical protein Ait01nite_093230 [Actinoplanes italicus]